MHKLFSTLCWILLWLASTTIAQGTLDFSKDLTMHYDSRCDTGRVQAMNEARRGHAQLRKAYMSDNVPDWLNKAMRRWFGFDKSSDFFKYIDLTIGRMASVIRVMERERSRIGLYCETGPGIADTETQDNGALVHHKPSGSLHLVSQVPCALGDDHEAEAVNNWPGVREKRLPNFKFGRLQRGVIHHCDLNGPPRNNVFNTLRDLAGYKLDGIRVSMPKTYTSINSHEMAHLSDISFLDLGFGQAVYNYKSGRDWHKEYSNGRKVGERNGYYQADNSVEGRFILPPEGLIYPEFIVLNPDNYSLFLEEFLMHMYGWDIVEDAKGNLVYKRGTRSKEEIKAFGTWPRGQPPNWSDAPTVEQAIPLPEGQES